jgi:hypothetical protein
MAVTETRGNSEMVSIKTGLHCPFCNLGIIGESVICCNCEHSWVWPSIEEYEGWYRTPHYHTAQYLENRGKTCSELYGEARKAAIERLRFLEPFRMCSSPRLVDVGCGNNAFVDEASYEGFHAFGVDPNPLGTALKGEWKDLTQKWNFICAHDLMEHLTDPIGFLGHLKSCMDEDSLMVIEMPEFRADGWERHRKIKEHVTLYSRESAEALYEKCGLKVVLFYRPLRGKLAKMSHLLQLA